jgi:NADPH:quinone reductase-like Zn-dependent oxidoreductase
VFKHRHLITGEKGLFMRKVTITKAGSPAVLALVNSDKPTAGKNEICIKVNTVGVAFADTLLREGVYPGFKAKGTTPGYDVVGTIDSIGDSADESEFNVGDKVVALTEVGGYADYCTVSKHRVALCPEGLDDVETVSLVLNYLTAYQMLTHIARVKPGDTILIHGAAGGVGTALVQLCKVIGGITIYGTASKMKHQMLVDMGVRPIDYQHEDFVEVIKESCPEGIDIVFDAIGGKNWKRSYRVLRTGGLLMAYGFSSITKNGRFHFPSAIKSLLSAPFPGLLTVLNDTKGVLGYNIRAFTDKRPESFRPDMQVLLGLLKSGKIKPVVGKVLSLDQVKQAHELMGESAVQGKIVLVVNK